MTLTPSLTLHNLSFQWPTGERAFSDLDMSFPTGRTGLTGVNGSGKSTLLQLMSGNLVPTKGSIEVSGKLGYLPQTLTLQQGANVAQLLGIADTYRGLKAIEGGSVNPLDFDAVGDRWDLEARVEAELSAVGLEKIGLERQVSTLSGGEVMLLAVLGLRLAALPITLLDEPTNNLDSATKELLYTMLRSWKGTLIIVSHDIELLELMDQTMELHAGKLRIFGGPYSAYREQLATEQAAATQAAKTAQASLKVEKRQRVEAETKLARAKRKGRAEQLGGGLPKILANSLRQKSESSAGKMRSQLTKKVDIAQSSLAEAESLVRSVQHINVELPDPQLPAGKQVAELISSSAQHIIQGPERVALIGQNGSGKTTLLEQLLGQQQPDAQVTGKLFVERVGYLPQLLVGLDESRSAVENIGTVAPSATTGQIRNMLARLLLRDAKVDRPLAALSGGERFRVYLASLLLAEPTAQLLILDEPTNNLDIDSVRQLCEALAAYRGALLVVSHDQNFLTQLNLDYLLELTTEGSLTKSYPTPVR